MRRIAILGLVSAILFLGCGNTRVEDTVLPPTPFDEVSFVEDNVLVTFTVETLEQFSQREFVFTGSLRNLGGPRSNARFEVLATQRLPAPTGERRVVVLVTQRFGTFEAGQTQLITARATLPSVDNSVVTGRFTHD